MTEQTGTRTPATPFPAEWAADVLATDGRVVHLRPIVPADSAKLAEFHGKLSERTRYLRYFGPYPTLSERDLVRMTTIDYRERMAFLAILDDQIIAMGLYESLDSEGKPESAEVAFVVADEHQGRGLGPILLEHLAAVAGESGFKRFEAEVLSENPTMVAVFRDAGYQLERSFDGSTIHVEFTIDPTDAQRAVRNARERASEARSVANLLRPESVAVIGASTDPRKVGNAVLANVIAGGFTGPVFPVNADRRSVMGIRAYPTVRDIPDPVDLAIVAVPAGAVDEVLDDCLAKGVKSMVVVSAGFSEIGSDGSESENRLVESVRSHGMRLVGPNALGVANNEVGVRLNATLAPRIPGRGRVGFFCQSGALGIAILDEAARRRLGLSSFVSAGNRADLSGNDMLQYWDSDADTEVVLLYLESYGNPRKFSRLARHVARSKPVLVVSNDLGEDDELLRQFGVIPCSGISELFDCATVLAYQPLPAGPRVRIITNSLVLGEMAAAAGARDGIEVDDIVDLEPGAAPAEFEAAVVAATADDSVHAIMAVFVPPVAVSVEDYAGALLSGSRGSAKPIVSTFLAVDGIPPGLSMVDDGGVPVRGSIPSFATPERAVSALAQVSRYAKWLREPRADTDLPAAIDAARATALIEAAIDAGARVLDDDAAAELAACYGISVIEFRTVTDPAAAIAAAHEIGYPVALKAVSPHWRRRADREGVRLDLPDEHAVASAFADLVALTGDTELHVQAMASKGFGVAITAGDHPAAGSLISFGLSGPLSDLVGDRAVHVVPLSAAQARELVDAPLSAPLLSGYGGSEPVDKDAIADVLQRVSLLVDQQPGVRTVRLDPILAAPGGAAVLSVEIEVGPVPSRSDSGPRRLR